MTKFILRWAINAVALYLAVYIVPGVNLEGGFTSIIWLALIFLTLGLFTLLINTFLFWLTGQVGQAFGIGLTINGFWPAFFGGLIVTVVSVIMSLILKDELKRRG